MPSPYDRQRPLRTVAVGPRRETNSATRRDLPTPGSPTIVTRRQRRSAAASPNNASRAASSMARPPSAVDPLMSQNRSVASLRRSGAGSASGAPQNGQNGNSPGSSLLQLGQA